jgi:large subunit ribosomal protein L30
VTEKAQRTVRIKWVRSGIGFSYRQKEMLRSLGFRRLNQVVERPDTPQTRGLVARVPHLVTIVDEPSRPPVLTSVPEYTLRPPEVVPGVAHEALPAQEESAATQVKPSEPVAEPAAAETVVMSGEETPPAERPKAKRPRRPGAAESKTTATKKAKVTAEKPRKPSKAGKK